MVRLSLFLSSIALLLILSVNTPITAQNNESDDPLKGERDIIDESKLALLWSDWHGENADLHYALFDFVTFGNPAIEDSLTEVSRNSLSGEFQTYGDKARDIVAGRFTGGDIDDVVMVWEGCRTKYHDGRARNRCGIDDLVRWKRLYAETGGYACR
jgi:hypothetical protein